MLAKLATLGHSFVQTSPLAEVIKAQMAAIGYCWGQGRQPAGCCQVNLPSLRRPLAPPRRSGSGGRLCPCLVRRRPEAAQGGSGYEMLLDVEGVVPFAFSYREKRFIRS
jgi:hypothetical protein